MSWDIILVGGGLANGFIAKAMRFHHPSAQILVLEASDKLGGNHTWCWHDSDLPETPAWMHPLIERKWAGYDVIFKGHSRTLTGGYSGLRSDFFAKSFQEENDHIKVRHNTRVHRIYPHGVETTCGETLTAKWVIDGRGQMATELCGYQKFLGIYVELEQPHALRRPILMDARVEQHEDFRFVYTLPWGDRTLLVEDTMYSDHAHIDLEVTEQRLLQYCQKQGWIVRNINHRESAALPIPLHQQQLKAPQTPTIKSGIQSALFHATTGYSLPMAVRYAEYVAKQWPCDQETVAGTCRVYSSRVQACQTFFRRLNNMMFLACPGKHRHLIFERFYRLPSLTIERFYSGQLRLIDKLRILIGKPPVPLWRGLRCFFKRPIAQQLNCHMSSPSTWLGKGIRG